MFDFNNLKSKVMDSINKAADTTRDFADKATDKAKDVSRIAKLSLEINSEKDVIRKAYSEIGKLYYETHKDDPEGFFIQLCDEVTLAMENITAKEAEIAELKSNNSTDDDNSIVVEFEEVVSEDEHDGCCEKEDDACCCNKKDDAGCSDESSAAPGDSTASEDDSEGGDSEIK
ncbi:MAG: hypothetical protein AB7D36_03305 [Oscillospiraceae bacterium]